MGFGWLGMDGGWLRWVLVGMDGGWLRWVLVGMDGGWLRWVLFGYMDVLWLVKMGVGWLGMDGGWLSGCWLAIWMYCGWLR